MKSVYVRYFRRHRRHNRRWRTIIIILTCLGTILGSCFFQCRPIMTTFAESQAVWIATKIANQTAAQAVLDYADVCDSTVLVVYDSSQKVSSVSIDTASVNLLRTAMVDRTISKMESIDSLTVAIPFGTLTGWDWFSGLGPLLSFPFSFTATVLSDISSSLVATGINQSTYRVLIHLDISLYVVSPAGRSSVGTHVTYPVAETVLLGEVPDNFTEVYGDDQSLLGQIFDYGTLE